MITLFFSDIEGSTRQWESDPAQMRQVLERHDQLLIDGIEHEGGRVVLEKGEGDSFFAVFSEATAALAAALACQRSLASEAWPGGASLRVRVAIHSAEVDPDFRGPDTNRAARIRAIGHGGQTLVSRATEALVRDTLPPRTTLVDLGEHRLKDLSRPERVFQLAHPDLQASFPPLKSLDSFSHNLPVQVTSFVGRESEIESLSQELEQARLVTLTGTGGTGKTRLALHVAGGLVGSFPEGVHFVDLSPLADPDLVTPAIAATLGVRENPVTCCSRVWRARCGRGAQLLLLDNCEHLIDTVARVVGELLTQCPRLTVLATSREGLGVPGELVWRVPSLGLPDPEAGDLASSESVRLFVERAAAARRGFALTEENSGPVGDICRRLDGVPLAIELAAARTSAMSPAEILKRLEDRFRLLTGGARTAVARQQTLEAAVDWSHDLLGEQEKVLFRRLSVFSGGFNMGAAEAVCAGAGLTPGDVLDLLVRLVDRSLVVADDPGAGETRYRLLETLRQYGRKKLLEAGEADALQNAHLSFFGALVDSVMKERSREQNLSLDRLQVDQDNLRTALDWSAALAGADDEIHLAVGAGWLWATRGPYREGRERLLEILERRPEQTVGRARVLLNAGALSVYVGDSDGARRYVEEAIEIFRRAGNEPGETEAIARLAFSHWAVGDIKPARENFEVALEMWRKQERPGRVAYVLVMLGQLALADEDYPAAHEMLEESQALARARGDLRSMMLAESLAGNIALREGDYALAARSFRQSLELARQHGDRQFMTVGLEMGAMVAAALGELVHAAILEGASTSQRQKLGVVMRPPWIEPIREKWSQFVSDGLSDADQQRGLGRRMTLEQAVAMALDGPLARVTEEQGAGSN